jgi:hypothetical protein
MNQFTRDNCRLLLARFIEENDLDVRRVAKVIGCSEATLIRILATRSLPSDEMMKQVGILIELGFVSYSKLSNTQKEHISEAIGTVGGGILGFGSISAAISTLGTVSGLSAAGIATGLSTLGAVIGGGMVAGVIVAAAIPIVASATGYGIIKGVKYLADEWQLNVKELNERWEITIASEDE